MANAKIDDNWNEALLAVSSVNGETPVRLEANPTTGALLVDGTVGDGTTTANVLTPTASSSAQAGQNGLIVVPSTGVTTDVITLDANNTTSSWYDLLNYPFITAVVLSNTGTTLTWQTSSDPSQAIVSSMGFGLSGNTTNSAANTVGSGVTGNYYAARVGRYFRISSNASGGNSATVRLTFYTIAPYPTTIGVQAAISGVWGFESRANTSAPTVTAVAASASSTTLKASLSTRRGLTVFNDADKALYVKMGATASTTSFTVKIAAGGYWEMPQFPTYTGVVDGIWEAAPTGNALVTEILS